MAATAKTMTLRDLYDEVFSDPELTLHEYLGVVQHACEEYKNGTIKSDDLHHVLCETLAPAAWMTSYIGRNFGSDSVEFESFLTAFLRMVVSCSEGTERRSAASTPRDVLRPHFSCNSLGFEDEETLYYVKH